MVATAVKALVGAVVIAGIGVTMLAITLALRGRLEASFEPAAVGPAGTPDQVSATRRVQARALLWAGLALVVFIAIFHTYVFAETPLD